MKRQESWEPEIIQILAAISAMPRWVVALMPADGAVFPWAHSPGWSLLSAGLAALFAIVEIFAAGYIMRAYRLVKADSPTERRLLFIIGLIILTLMVTMGVPGVLTARGLQPSEWNIWLHSIWFGCVTMSTFLVIGGVGYAEKQARSASSGLGSAPKPAGAGLAVAQAEAEPAKVWACDFPGCVFTTSKSYAALNGHKIKHRGQGVVGQNGHSDPGEISLVEAGK